MGDKNSFHEDFYVIFIFNCNDMMIHHEKLWLYPLLFCVSLGHEIPDIFFLLQISKTLHFICGT